MAFDSLRSEGETERHPLGSLPREDLDLIAELVLQSGSLKDLAAAYGVSYPTIRARLDRVIERLRGAMEGRARDPLSEVLAGLVERGEMSVGAARLVREAARRSQAAAITQPVPAKGPASTSSPDAAASVDSPDKGEAGLVKGSYFGVLGVQRGGAPRQPGAGH